MRKIFLLLTALMVLNLQPVVAQTSKSPSGTHLKKDGTPDKRYKEHKAGTTKGPKKKDGTPDMRYKANQTGKKK